MNSHIGTAVGGQVPGLKKSAWDRKTKMNGQTNGKQTVIDIDAGRQTGRWAGWPTASEYQAMNKGKGKERRHKAKTQIIV